MAADSDGWDLTAVVTCEGDLGHPEFPARLDEVVNTLNVILGGVVKVRKLEPWNSVRVTLSIPREAALRLRQLASEGSHLLKALGILSVQVEGDQVISLRIAPGPLGGEPQDIVLRTSQDGSGTSATPGLEPRRDVETSLVKLFSGNNAASAASSSGSEKVQFKSPNVVCPSDSVVPKVVVTSTPTSSKSPFPFTSMNQALHSREAVQQPPPPPYPQQPPVSISSPLLVNLLQNDGPESNGSVVMKRTTVPANSPSALTKHQPVSTSSCASVMQPPPPLNMTRTPMPPPPPYPTTATWSSPTHLPDLTPSLTDLKVDDLEEILPSLEHDLAHSPPDLPEELINHAAESPQAATDAPATDKHFLINPLTGELEPQSSGESDAEEEVWDVFTDLPSPRTPFSDEDTNSTSRTDGALNPLTDQSDSDTRSSLIDTTVKHRYKNTKSREKGRDSPGLKPTEKIKLRLKLEKSEPVNPAYKVDVSFINMQQPKKASVVAPPPPNQMNSEELRVPPLHISLRGRNHVVITNKKRTKLLTGEGGGEKPDKLKIRKTQEYVFKKKPEDDVTSESVTTVVPVDLGRSSSAEVKKVKKPKIYEHKEGLLMLHDFHYKEKQKERRGSDSELTKASKKLMESNGVLNDEKKRRLSQSDSPDLNDLPGSTNIGTVVGLPKIRKDKPKSKDLNRGKSYSKNLADKLAKQQVALPTGEIDMEAKFKQRLLEGINRPPHRTETPTPEKPPPPKEKSPEPDKCNTPERKTEMGEKQVSRSPNGGAQGEDSGIESMDALSEKSPNQASQSPHSDLPESALKHKTQVPDMLDIEAQLAKMEEDCCEINALQHEGEKYEEHENVAASPKAEEVNLLPIEPSKEETLDPLPVRVAPPLYTYSNPEKTREQDDNQSDEDDANTNHPLHKKSLLEQLLIEIPNEQPPGSPSPATRSVRTRASSKLNSPEINLNSPVTRQQRSTTPATKRKRQESDSSEDARNKKTRKCSENAAELIKACIGGADPVKVNNVKKAAPANMVVTAAKANDESSDSDEPLIEKMRKSNNTHHPVANKTKVKTGTVVKSVSAPLSTRRSVRTNIPAQNTRSKGDKVVTEADVRRKTRSAVSETDNKRKKEIK